MTAQPEISPKVLTIAAARTAVVRGTTTWADFPLAWKRMLDLVHSCTDASHRPGRNVMLYLDQTPTVEVGVELLGPLNLRPPVVESELPAGTVAYLLHEGDYATMGQSHDRLVAWCMEQGLQRKGPLWEVYGHMREGVEPTVELYHLLSDMD
jgi:hypothetical protein